MRTINRRHQLSRLGGIPQELNPTMYDLAAKPVSTCVAVLWLYSVGFAIRFRSRAFMMLAVIMKHAIAVPSEIGEANHGSIRPRSS